MCESATSSTPAPRPPRRRTRAHSVALTAAVLALLTLHAALAVTSVLRHSLTYDEAAHLALGLTVLRQGHFGTFPQATTGALWMALPAALNADVALPTFIEPYPATNDFVVGWYVMFEEGNDAVFLRTAGRLMMVLVSLALGVLVFLWSKRLYGPVGGLISLTLYALSPTILAHAPLMTIDLPIALALLASSGALWRVMRHVSPLNLALSAAACALALVTKPSGIVVVPLAVALGLVRLAWPAQMSLGLAHAPRWHARSLAWRTLTMLSIALGHVVLGVGVIWLFYGLRYHAWSGDPLVMAEMHNAFQQMLASSPGLPAAVVSALHQSRLLPEAFVMTYAHFAGTTVRRESFLFGNYSVIGWWYFFPVAFTVKTALGVWAALLLASYRGYVETWGARYHSRRLRLRRLQLALLRTAPLWLLIVCYLAMAMTATINIGHRHILPVYPALFILAGVLGKGLRWPRIQWRTRPWVWACLVVLAIECAWIWPSYLAFFNAAAGGPSNGYKLMVDSSLDWGQDLPLLRDYLDRHDLNPPASEPPRVNLAYFGSDQPESHGINVSDLIHANVQVATPFRPGIYIVSATYYQSIYIGPLGPWHAQQEQRYQELKTLEPMLMLGVSHQQHQRLVETYGEVGAASLTAEYYHLRLGRLMAYLSTQPIADRVGYTMLVFHLDANQIHEALQGNVPITTTRPRGEKPKTPVAP